MDPIDRVLQHVLPCAPGLGADQVMVVGATCRDLHHHAWGHRFATSATHDLDLALALRSWDAFEQIAATFPPVGETGIRFAIAGVHVDLVPFGDIEAPDGVARPPLRGEQMGVWALNEIYAEAMQLTLPSGIVVNLPTTVGYTAAKIGAWLDRSDWNEVKDAADLALVVYWHSESSRIVDRLYETDAGQAVLVAHGMDVLLAAAHLLGQDVATTVGEMRLVELARRWPGDRDLLMHAFHFPGGTTWPRDLRRRGQVIDAITEGLMPGFPAWLPRGR